MGSEDSSAVVLSLGIVIVVRRIKASRRTVYPVVNVHFISSNVYEVFRE